MYYGLPVVCTDFQMWKEIIDKYNCGICVNPNNVDEISSAINRLIKNPEETLKMGINARKAIIEKYNWQENVIDLINMYSKLFQNYFNS